MEVIGLKLISVNSNAVGMLVKAVTLLSPSLPIKLRRMENITVPLGTVIPVTVASSHEKVILPDATCVVPKLATLKPGNP